jgi:hypothetical protein
MLEMKIVLRAVVRARDLEGLAGTFARPRRRNITIAPADGCVLRLPLRAGAGPPAPAELAREPVLSAAGG